MQRDRTVHPANPKLSLIANMWQSIVQPNLPWLIEIYRRTISLHDPEFLKQLNRQRVYLFHPSLLAVYYSTQQELFVKQVGHDIHSMNQTVHQTLTSLFEIELPRMADIAREPTVVRRALIGNRLMLTAVLQLRTARASMTLQSDRPRLEEHLMLQVMDKKRPSETFDQQRQRLDLVVSDVAQVKAATEYFRRRFDEEE